ncbi:hypothetical protein [Anaeromyxobacter sp. SG26]|uniref:hypothetical protein n=1 Tax=Anaeromyxobacter sp. SG26 TaxID=2925407 RepID=UPI001F5A0A09|nr:hypothetical protein [Anaeromyxobacter sp. SG26]
MRLEHDVLVDLEVWDDLCARGLRVIFEKSRSDYALVVDRAGKDHGPVHLYTAVFRWGAAAVAGHDVHHLRPKAKPNKLDNRYSNLALNTRADHAKIHAIERKATRRNYNVEGLWRDRQRSSVKPVDPDEPRPEYGGKTLREVYAAPRTWDDVGDKLLSRRDLERDAERRLEDAYERLKRELAWFDSGKPIPRQSPAARWDDPNTRKLRLREPTLGCTNAEAALIFALVKYESITTGELDLDAAAGDVGVNRGIIERMMNRVAVALALGRWRRHRRLPHVGPRTA